MSDSKVEWVLSERQLEFFDNRSFNLVLYGAAGSGKTIFACHKLLRYVLEHQGCRCCVLSDTRKHLEETVLVDLEDLMRKYGISYQYDSKTNIMYFPRKPKYNEEDVLNPSRVFIKGLKDMSEVRSMSLDMIYVEQAERLKHDDYVELEARIRNRFAKEDYGQILYVVTPEHRSGWVYQRFHKNYDPEDDCLVHFNYKDNPFTTEAFKRRQAKLKETNPERYLTHTLGMWMDNEGLVYNNYSIGESSRGYEFFTIGGDWGWSAPSVLLLIGWFDGNPYVFI